MESNTEDKKWKVYIHTNKINQKRYVGITSRDPKKRWRNGKGYKQHKHFYAAIKKYGWENFDHRIVSDNLTEQDAKDLEIMLIQVLRTQSREYGYNITQGGNGHSCPSQNRVPVCQFTEDGNFVREYPCIMDAAEAISKNKGREPLISAACKGKQITALGYCWRYKSDCEDLEKIKKEILSKMSKKKDTSKYGANNRKRICQLDKDGNLINIFESLTSASIAVEGAETNLGYACRTNTFSHGYRWMYEEDYQKILDGIENFVVRRPKSDHILQFDQNRNLLHEYSDIVEATEETGISKNCISYASLKHRMSHGYFWEYKSNYYDDGIINNFTNNI